MKRFLDIVFSLIGLIVLSPLFLVVCFLVWKQDYHSPFYTAPRVGVRGRLFQMIKLLRKLKVDASLINVSKRDQNLVPFPPLGSNEIVTIREN